MAMSQATLETELGNMGDSSSESTTITNLSNAYAVYVTDAEADPVPIEADTIVIAKAAMAGAMKGIGVTGAGPAKLLAGIVAFWASILATYALSFPTAVAMTPPPHATFAASLALMVAGSDQTREKAIKQIAGIMNTNATTLGTVTFPPAVITSIT